MLTLNGARPGVVLYASNEVYEFTEQVYGYPAGTRVRLAGATPNTLGQNDTPGFMTVTLDKRLPNARLMAVKDSVLRIVS